MASLLVMNALALLFIFCYIKVLENLIRSIFLHFFTPGAAIHVFTSQVKDLLGIKLSPVVGNFKIILVTVHGTYNSNNKTSWTQILVFYIEDMASTDFESMPKFFQPLNLILIREQHYQSSIFKW